MSESLQRRLDVRLLVISGLIAFFGVYNLASASQPLAVDLHYRHLAHLLVGALLMFLAMAFHYRHLESLGFVMLSLAIVLLLATGLFGKMVNGSRRWLPLGFFDLQTSDFTKLAVIVALAKMLKSVPDRTHPGLTLRQIFRPLNLSRPIVALFAVVLFFFAGEALFPAKLKRPAPRGRYRTVVTVEESGRVVLGGQNSERADVRVRGRSLEPEHAVIEGREGSFWIQPLAPIWINGELLTKPAELHDGASIRFAPGQGRGYMFKAPMTKFGPYLGGLFILALIWLGISLVEFLGKPQRTLHDVVAPIDVVVVPAAMVLVQPDLGTALVIILIAFSMILFLGLEKKSFLILAGSGAVAATFAWQFVLKAYQKERIMTFLNPTSDLSGAGYHQHQSLIAVGSGGFWGKGHGQGTQTQLSFLPEQQTDFIFSVWAEEHGFLGSLLLVGLFSLLVWVSFAIALRARDRFGSLLAVGVAAVLFWHTVINMLMVLRFAPVVGVPLPLFSSGGSFVVTVLLGLGLLHNVSARQAFFRSG